jgi:lipoprotein-anchoring transpeptidase ErfK/SrfK
MLTTLTALLVAAVIGLAPGSGPLPDGEPWPDPPPPPLSYGDSGPIVAELNTRLAAAGFRPDDDDRFGPATYQAVLAFQKHLALDRDGTFRPAAWGLLDERPTVPYRDEDDRVEVDLGKQVLYLVEDNAVVAVIPVSSGNGEAFRSSTGAMVRAVTPEGAFSFERSIPGIRRSYLGELYNPFYFQGGYAIHGSPSVPAHPASHGCVRVTNTDMDFLKTRFRIGMPVMVYGQRTEPPPPDGVEILRVAPVAV